MSDRPTQIVQRFQPPNGERPAADEACRRLPAAAHSLAGEGPIVRPRKLLFLSDCYLEGASWGPYHTSLLTYLGTAFDEILAVKGNAFFHEWVGVPRSETHLAHVREKVRTFEPDLIFNINRVGPTAELLAMTRPDVPLITLYVDYHDRLPAHRHDYGPRDRVWITGGGGLAQDFLRSHGHGLSEHQLAVGTGWAVDPAYFQPCNLPRLHDLIFIGTPFFPEDFTELLLALRGDEANRRIFLDVYDEHRRRYIYDWPEALHQHGFDPDRLEPNLGPFFRENYRLQMHVCDQISGANRLRFLSALADLDLKIYGAPLRHWILALSLGDIRLLRCYQYRHVAELTEVAHLYNTAKIGLNIQHDHSRDHGVSFRAFDLMACKTLLMTHCDTRKPLNELGFVENQDYVCFETPQELRQKCLYYLSHEKQRQIITESAYEKVLERYTLPRLFGRVFGHFGYPALTDHFQRLCREGLRPSDLRGDLPVNVHSLTRLPETESRPQEPVRAAPGPQDDTTSLYVDCGEGYSERHRVRVKTAWDVCAFRVTFDLSIYPSIRAVRWDPLEGCYCKVWLESVHYRDASGKTVALDLCRVTNNGTPLSEGAYLFDTADPMFFLPLEGDITAVILQGCWQLLLSDEQMELEKRLESNRQELRMRLAIQEEKLRAIRASRWWRLTCKLSSLSHLLRGRRTRHRFGGKGSGSAEWSATTRKNEKEGQG